MEQLFFTLTNRNLKQINIVQYYFIFGVTFAIINQIKFIIMLKHFFILCSGADKDLLENCSEVHLKFLRLP